MMNGFSQLVHSRVDKPENVKHIVSIIYAKMSQYDVWAAHNQFPQNDARKLCENDASKICDNESTCKFYDKKTDHECHKE